MAFDFNPEQIINPGKGDGQNPSRYVPLIIMVVFFTVILFLLTSVFYTVDSNEVGVVLRFGKFNRITEPGLHFKLPAGIENAIPVKVKLIYKEEFGFRTRSDGVRTLYSQKGYDDESLMLTGDLNVLNIEWIVQYKIKDPYKYLFKLRNPVATLRDISESVMRRVVGDLSFNDVLKEKRVEINNMVQQELQSILDSYDSGIDIVTVKLQDVNPPDPVKPAFNEVNAAQQEKEKMINQAWGVYNKKIPQAKGEALKIVSEAEGYQVEKVNNATGEANRFKLLLDAYNKAKDVTQKRLYLESMQEILSNAGNKYVLDPEEMGILPLLNLKNNNEKNL